MKITSQSIEWLGDEEVRITTTRSKGGRGFGFVRIGRVGIGGKSRGKSAEVTDVVEMDHERYQYERKRIENGRFRAYDPEKFYRYEDTPEAKQKERLKRWRARFNQWREKRKDAKRKRKREGQANMDLSKVATRPPRTVWFGAIIVTIGYWVLMGLLTGTLVQGSILYWVLSIGWVLAWAIMPVAIYRDQKRASSHAPNWFPNGRAYVLGALIPYLDVAVGVLYLYRRWKYGRENDFRRSDSETADNQPSA